MVVSGVWLVAAGVGLTVGALGESSEGHHGDRHDNGVLLFVVLIGVPVLTWIGGHLAVSLCLLRGQRWARPVVIGAFAVSGLLPLWLLPGYLVGFVNALLCGAVVAAAWPRR